MRNSTQTWRWECSAPLRADAESVFVPCSEVPDANVGDTIVVTAHSGGQSRTGTVAAWTDGDNEMFFRVTLER